MIRTLAVAALFSLALAGPAAARLRVVATTPDLAALMVDLGGDQVEVISLVSADQDPHHPEISPTAAADANHAQALVANGLGLEASWLPALLAPLPNRRIQPGGSAYFEAAAFITPRDSPAGNHPHGNPHFLRDPRAAARVVVGLAGGLGRLDPDNARVYEGNARVLAQRLETFATEQTGRFAGLAPDQRQLATAHATYSDLCDWLGLKLTGVLEVRPGEVEAGPHATAFVAELRRTRTRVLAVEAAADRGPAETVARLAPVKLVLLPTATRFGTEGYIDHLRRLTDILFAAMQE